MNYTKGNIEPTADDCISQAKQTHKWQQFENSGKDSNGRIVLRIPEKDANKYLSAPDLYEALKYIIRELDKADIIKADSIFMAMPQKAIAKAEGK